MGEVMSSDHVRALLEMALAAAPLGLFVRQDLRRWKVKDWLLLAMLLLVPSLAVLRWSFGLSFWEPLTGAAVFFAVAMGIRELAYRATGIEAFGAADVVIAAFAGAFLGWRAVLVWLLVGSVAGVLLWTWMASNRKREGRRPRRRVPAGPGFAVAQVLLMAATELGLYAGFPFS
jgi:prepilin signal peptidase PulO-like enzyme (type II secretory pathway)